MKMKAKTHSGAKKRLRVLPGGKVKRKKKNRRHLLECKNRKRVRHLGLTAYIDKSDMGHVKKLLNI